VSVEQNKALVRRLVQEVVTERDPDALDELAKGQFARLARRWISPFQNAFPDFRMEIVDLIAEDDRPAGLESSRDRLRRRERGHRAGRRAVRRPGAGRGVFSLSRSARREDPARLMPACLSGHRPTEIPDCKGDW